MTKLQQRVIQATDEIMTWMCNYVSHEKYGM